MQTTFRHYSGEPGFSEDFIKVRDFLIRVNEKKMITTDFTWERWEWIHSLPNMNRSRLPQIGLWEDQGRIVAMATYEEDPGGAYFIVDPAFMHLKKEMLLYAEAELAVNGFLKALINDGDVPFQKIAQELGFIATKEKEGNSVFDISPDKLKYELAEGYSITSLAETHDIYKYNCILWRGFNHGEKPSETEEQILKRRISLSGPHNNLDLKIAVVAPNGDFASYCGMWYEPGTDYCLVEPVATDPSYRLMGCGKAAVLEGIKRCTEMGAKRAFVGSDQQFYYSIGFRPLPQYSFWKKQSRNRTLLP